VPALGANVDPLHLLLTPHVAAPQLAGASITLTGAITKHANGQVPYTFLFQYSLDGVNFTSIGSSSGYTSTATSLTCPVAWTPTLPGNYTLKFTFSDRGGGSAFITSTYLIDVTSVSLAAGAVSPQPRGMPITLTANAGGGDVLYQFQSKLGSGSWTNLGSWQSGNTYAWQPAVDGSYALQVLAKTNGGATTKTSASLPYVIATPLSAVTLATTPTGWCNVNTALTLTATPTGGATPQYLFQYQLGAGSWTTIGSYQTAATTSWTPATAGRYTLQVLAREQGTTTPVYTSPSVSVTVNTPPVANNRTVTVNQNTTNTPITLSATDADGNPLTYTTTAPAHGTLSGSGATRTYTPTAGYYGADSFTYTVSDGYATSTSATVTLTVNAVPLAVSDAYTVEMNTVLTISSANGVLANDRDADGGTLTAVKVTNPAHGAVTLSGDGSFTYTPTTDYVGTDTFSYTTGDGGATSNPATVTVTVYARPLAVTDRYTTVAGQALTLDAGTGVLMNDQAPNGAALSAQLTATVAHGTLTLTSDGAFTYTPTAGYIGTDSFSYTANDGFGTSDSATVTLTVLAIPVAADDVYAVPINGQLTVTAAAGVLRNDTDALGHAVTASLASLPQHGKVTLTSSGAFTYTPYTNYAGSDAFTYTASDGPAVSAPATVSLSVHALPTAQNVSYYLTVGDTLAVKVQSGLLQHGADLDNDALTVAKATEPAHGTVTVAGNGAFTYTPTPRYAGADTFTYTLSDGVATSKPATVTLIVNAVPVAGDDSYSVVAGNQLAVAAPGVLKNDTDAYGGSKLTVTKTSDVAHGTLVLNSDGSFTYLRTPGYVGTDRFTYTATDGLSTASPATVTITVTPGGALVLDVGAQPQQPVNTVIPLTAMLTANTAGASYTFAVALLNITTQAWSAWIPLPRADVHAPTGSWQPTVAGTYAIRVVATDAAGKVYTSNTCSNFFIRSEALQGIKQFTAPTGPLAVRGTAMLNTTVLGSGVGVRYDYTVSRLNADGVTWGVWTALPHANPLAAACGWQPTATGYYAFKVVATDPSGNVAYAYTISNKCQVR